MVFPTVNTFFLPGPYCPIVGEADVPKLLPPYRVMPVIFLSFTFTASLITLACASPE